MLKFLLLLTKKYTCIGGQAVIEGVMMRSPHYMAIAVRQPDQTILVKELPWQGIVGKFPIFKKPFLRGVVTLVESMVNGVEALTFSANVAAIWEEKAQVSKDGKAATDPQGMSKLEMVGSLVFAFAMGMGLFVAAPHLLTLGLGKLGLFTEGMNNPLFHLIDGAIKVLFLVTYISLISLMNDVKRVFQYHGAEHKSIYAFENGDELTVANAKKYPTMHPRCGTSFLLFLLIISILIFSVVMPFFNEMFFVGNPILHQASTILVKIALMFPVAGVSYEFIRLTGNNMDNPVVKFLIYPGLMLQKLTTKEPSDDQLEIALASLKKVLLLEKNPETLSKEDVVLQNIQQIPSVPAEVTEFLG